MRIGVTAFLTDTSIRPAHLAVALEERGLHALYLAEHTHIPISRRTPAPLGEPLPGYYRRLLDPFTALTAAAAVTTTLRIGTAICLVAQHDPISLAKTVATVDLLSGGRFSLGIGFGWNREEMADHGVDYGRRRDVVAEYVAAMRGLWRADSAAAGFSGEFVSYEPSEMWPKPIGGGVPIMIGGSAGPKLFEHIARYADGWMPVGGGRLSESIPLLRRGFAERGRDPDTLRVVPCGTVPSEGKLAHYRSLGITEVVCQLPSVWHGGSATAEEILPVLDEYAKLI